MESGRFFSRVGAMKWIIRLLISGAALCLGAVAHAGLTFEKVELSRTADRAATETAADFKFKVTGDKPVKITDIATYCSCLKAKTKGDKLEFQPGEEGIVETAFLLGTFEGEVAKQVVVTTDDPAQPEITLTVKVTIPVVYKVEPESVAWDVGEEPKAKKMKFTIVDDKAIAVTGLVSSRDNMVAEVKEVTKGREYEITLTPKSTAEPMMGVLRVETDAPYPRFQKRLLFFNVKRPKATPAPQP